MASFSVIHFRIVVNYRLDSNRDSLIPEIDFRTFEEMKLSEDIAVLLQRRCNNDGSFEWKVLRFNVGPTNATYVVFLDFDGMHGESFDMKATEAVRMFAKDMPRNKKWCKQPDLHVPAWLRPTWNPNQEEAMLQLLYETKNEMSRSVHPT